MNPIINKIIKSIICIPIIFFLFENFGCRKDKMTYPTIYPLSYLPAYPGSYWKYNEEGTNQIFDLSVKDNYCLIGGRYKDFNGKIFDSIYVPVIGLDVFLLEYQSEIPVLGYSTLEKIDSIQYKAVKLLSENLNDNWQSHLSWGRNIFQCKVVAINDTMTVNNTLYHYVIQVHQIESNSPIEDIYYYAQDVGIIKICHTYESYSTHPPYIVTTYYDLVDYHINH
jgi:hypothetical protein